MSTNVKQLLARFAPYCCFHQKETSYPIAYETLLANSTLQIKNNKKTINITNDYKDLLQNMTPEQILSQWLIANPSQREEFKDGELFLLPHVDGEGMQGSLSADKQTLAALPVHGQVAEVTLNNTDGEPETYYRLTYIFIYRDNYPPHAFGLGDHLGDIEHVTLYVKRNDDGSPAETIHKMYYAAHNEFEGSWVASDDIEYKNGHPITYVARGSHADFPHLKEGTSFFSSTHYIARIFLFANDQIEKTGVNYQITEQDILPMPHPIRENYEMNAGKGVRLGKYYIKEAECSYSTNGLVRQLPKQLKLGPLTFWDPANHVKEESHQETVIRLLDFEHEFHAEQILNLHSA